MFTIPGSSQPDHRLDDLLLVSGGVWYRARAALDNPFTTLECFSALRDEASAAELDLASWQETRSSEFKPTAIGQVIIEQPKADYSVGFWPGPIDTYVDMYVAGVWNTSRVARLLLISLMWEISIIIHDGADVGYEKAETIRIVDQIVASVPYH
jgi:hypothetical protein